MYGHGGYFRYCPRVLHLKTRRDPSQKILVRVQIVEERITYVERFAGISNRRLLKFKTYF